MWFNFFLFLLFLVHEVVAVSTTASPASSVPAALVVAGAGVGALLKWHTCRHDGCDRAFQHAAHLRCHYQRSGHGPSAPVEKPIRRRGSYSFRRKRDILIELDNLALTQDTQFAAQLLSRRTGVHESLLSKWQNNKVEIFTRARTRACSGLRKYRPTGGMYPLAEAELYSRFMWRRRYLRLKTSKIWLRDNMLHILATTVGLTTFRASQGWCSRFCVRWEITSQCRTNKHKQSVLERLCTRDSEVPPVAYLWPAAVRATEVPQVRKIPAKSDVPHGPSATPFFTWERPHTQYERRGV